MAWGGFGSVTICCLYLLLPHEAMAQPISIPSGAQSPQAKTGDELDAFGLVYEARDSRVRIAAAESFLRGYPKSEFVEYACMAAMHAYHDLGNWDRSDEMARMALKANPENVDALLHRARLLIEAGHETPLNLAEAKRLAELGLARVNGVKLPASARSREWLRTKTSFLALGVSVLGWYSFRAGKIDSAIESFQRAIDLDPQGEYFYRLALVTAAAGDLEASLKWASLASKSGPARIAALAQRQIELLERKSNGKH
jgi:tetratricopeptide (TPR) repeat protein